MSDLSALFGGDVDKACGPIHSNDMYQRSPVRVRVLGEEKRAQLFIMIASVRLHRLFNQFLYTHVHAYSHARNRL